ncbi:translocase of chloroplast 159, chloroplastic [Tanacetum coccineum]
MKAQLQEIEKSTANTPKENAKGTTPFGKPPLPIVVAGKLLLPIAGGVEAEINMIEIEGIRYLDMNFLMHELNSYLKKIDAPAPVAVPLPDMALPPSFDSDNYAYRFRFLEPTS